MARSNSTSRSAFRLRIQPVIASAERLIEHVAQELPTHRGLARATRGVAEAAREAERISQKLKRRLGTHRLPALFVIATLTITVVWGYFHFIHVSTLKLAVSSVDAVQLRQTAHHRVRLTMLETEGSRMSIENLERGRAHLAFVQGGVDIPNEFPRTKLANSEIILFLRRDGVETIDKVLTSSKGQGSHSIAQRFMNAWEISDVEYTHEWRSFTEDENATVAPEIDAVFVVKDPANSRVSNSVRRLESLGFTIASVYVGAKQLEMPYLEETTITGNYLDPAAGNSDAPINTYRVATYLVARDDLTPRQFAIATSLLGDRHDLDEEGFEPTFSAASEVLQGVEAILGIFVYVGLAVLALFGLDIVAYRRRFNELNSLVSLISMHQSEKDVIFATPEEREHNIRYLGVCSDLLGLISVISGYYVQENSSLMYNRLFEIIHDRCSGLKINIQLKILHAGIGPHET